MSETLTTAVNPIHNTISLLFKDGDPIIISSLRMQSDFMEKKAFASIDEAEEFAQALDRDPAVSNIYVNLQQLRPGSTTDKRQDVAQYVRFLVDIDRKNKKVDGVRVNASDEERDSLRKAANDVSQWVSGILNAHPLLADSGNGFHLSWSLRPNAFTDAISPNEENKTTYKECLLAIKQRFDSESVEIDSSLSEPEQIIRLWGTHNRRDPETPGRPHRQSLILAKCRGMVSLAQLELLACEYQAPVSTKQASKGDAPQLHVDFDETAWWENYSEIFVCDEERDGWQVTSICPCTYEGKESPGHRHTGSKFTGVRFDRGIAEFHCFSDDHCDMTFGQVMKHLNQYFPKYRGRIWDWGDDDLTDFAEDVTASDAMPELKARVEPRAKRGKHGLTPEGELAYEASEKRIAQDRAELKEIEAEIEAEREEAEAGREITTAPPSGEFEIGECSNKEGIVQSLRVIKASNVVTERTEWWWQDRIPKGKISLFAGKPGCGKSFAVIDFIARLTTGRDFPNGSKNPWEPRECLLAASEDDPSDTLVPRLIAAGTDLDKVQIILWSTGKKIEGDVPKKRQRMLQLNKDTKLLKKALQENPNIALVAIDPMTSYFGADSNKDSEIRPVMDALSEACRASKAAFIGIMHYNKKSDVAALEKILGASSIVGSARTVWAFSRDPEDKTERHMSCAKNNLSKNHRGMKYKIAERLVKFSDGAEDNVGCVEWLGETEEDADDMLTKERDTAKTPKDSKFAEAKLLVQRELAKGEQRASGMFRLGEAQNISTETMRRAYRSMEVVPYQKNGGWWWSLPGMEVREVAVVAAAETSMGDVEAL